jgi:hypothetical protein
MTQTWLGAACFLCFGILVPPRAVHSEVAGYTEAGVKSVRLVGDAAVFAGGGIGIMTGERFSVGGRGFVLLNEVGTRREAVSRLNYGGVRLEYSQPLHRRVNLALGALFGLAEGEFIQSGGDTTSFGTFVGTAVEPDLSLAAEFLPRLQLRMEGSYLFLDSGVGLSGGMAGGATLRWRW